MRTQREEGPALTGIFADTSDETQTCTASVLCMWAVPTADVKVSDLMSGPVDVSLGERLM